jgi:hypothetical protein
MAVEVLLVFSFHDEDDVGPLEKAGGHADARVAGGSCGLDVNVPLTALQADAPWQLITERLLETAKGSEGQGFGDPADWGPLSSTALEPGVDTVETFDPNTYEIVEKVTPRSALAERTESIRLYHFLAWDEKKVRLAVSSIGYAPLVREYNYKYSDNSSRTKRCPSSIVF